MATLSAYKVVKECQTGEAAFKLILGIGDGDNQPRKSEQLHVRSRGDEWPVGGRWREEQSMERDKRV